MLYERQYLAYLRATDLVDAVRLSLKRLDRRPSADGNTIKEVTDELIERQPLLRNSHHNALRQEVAQTLNVLTRGKLGEQKDAAEALDRQGHYHDGPLVA